MYMEAHDMRCSMLRNLVPQLEPYVLLQRRLPSPGSTGAAGSYEILAIDNEFPAPSPGAFATQRMAASTHHYTANTKVKPHAVGVAPFACCGRGRSLVIHYKKSPGTTLGAEGTKAAYSSSRFDCARRQSCCRRRGARRTEFLQSI